MLGAIDVRVILVDIIRVYWWIILFRVVTSARYTPPTSGQWRQSLLDEWVCNGGFSKCRHNDSTGVMTRAMEIKPETNVCGCGLWRINPDYHDYAMLPITGRFVSGVNVIA